MPFFEVDSEQLFAELQDRDASRSIVAIHGSGADLGHWPPELTGLQGFNVYLLDLPGHGRSPGQGRDSVESYAGTVAEFIRQQGLSRVTLFGHSLGSAIALTLALRQPHWLEALVLVGAGARLRVLPELFPQLENDYPAAVELVCQSLFGPEAPPGLVEAERQRLLRTDWRLLYGDFTACDRFDVMDRLGEITVPALAVTGSADVLTPAKYARYLEEQMPAAQLAIIPGAGHMAALEQPEAWMRTVSAFLSEGQS